MAKPASDVLLNHPPRPLTQEETSLVAELNQKGSDSFRLVDWRACLQIGANAAWASDRGRPRRSGMKVLPKRWAVSEDLVAGDHAGVHRRSAPARLSPTLPKSVVNPA